jgi:hypothetical protein
MKKIINKVKPKTKKPIIVTENTIIKPINKKEDEWDRILNIIIGLVKIKKDSNTLDALSKCLKLIENRDK